VESSVLGRLANRTILIDVTNLVLLDCHSSAFLEFPWPAKKTPVDGMSNGDTATRPTYQPVEIGECGTGFARGLAVCYELLSEIVTRFE
jgi:hypothetical protein